MKTGIKILLGLTILAGLFFAGTGAWVWQSLNTPVKTGSREIVFTVTPGQSLNQISQALESSGLIPNAFLFSAYTRLQKAETRIPAGEHLLSGDLSPARILDQLLKGNFRLYRLTIPEGLNMDETAAIVAENGFCHRDDFLTLCRDPAFIADLNVPSHTLEGFLFPETYYFPTSATCRQIIEKMVATFFEVYTPHWQKKADDLGFTLQQVVTLASMVEKEAAVASERPLIASVFHNRLEKNMRLQSDPTVIYGDPEFEGRIRTRHLQRQTDYNTYQMHGLPKGPIASPGARAIEAVLFPAQSDYLYFVSRNDKTHHFSKTLAEHNRAVREYQLTPQPARQSSN
ncbi:MAG TPA: endolytic transglycosylase MltG [Desulfotignum sp.]|nr:endolytic transglycosylase MltG [Desulfotignum sp.]